MASRTTSMTPCNLRYSLASTCTLDGNLRSTIGWNARCSGCGSIAEICFPSPLKSARIWWTRLSRPLETLAICYISLSRSWARFLMRKLQIGIFSARKTLRGKVDTPLLKFSIWIEQMWERLFMYHPTFSPMKLLPKTSTTILPLKALDGSMRSS